MKRSFLWALILVLTSIGYAQAQTTVTGKVTASKSGESIEFTTVVLKGTMTSVKTDDGGNYSISIPANATDPTLQFSHDFGEYASKEVAVGTRSVVNVTLELASASVDGTMVLGEEVIITGYGQTRKPGETAGSVSVVKAKSLDQMPVTNFTEMLQGKATGVQVIMGSGRPGSAASIVIRGDGSFSASSQPLYIIDGVPVSASDFTSLNANDIENVSLLKDASSTAIYGSRAAGGVVLVSTKAGRRGDARIEFRTQHGFSTRTLNKVKLMNTSEKLTYERELGAGWGGDYSIGGGDHAGPMTDAEIAAAAAAHDTDWVKEMFRTGYKQQYEVNISGGDEKLNVYFTGSYLNDKAILINTGLERYTGRLNVSYKVRDWLNFTNRLTAGYTKVDEVYTVPNSQNPLWYADRGQPYTYGYNEDGSYHTDSFMPSSINVFELQDNTDMWSQVLTVINSTVLDFTITKDLKFITTLGLNYSYGYSYLYNYPESPLFQALGGTGNRSDSQTSALDITWNNVLAYKKSFNLVHNLNVMAGTEILKSDARNSGATSDGFFSKEVDFMSTGSGPYRANGSTSGHSLASVFGMASYNYATRYYLEGTIRTDGSSRFGSDNRWGVFWSIGAAWDVIKEDFMKEQNIVSALKLRGSYGITGNHNIGNYQWRGAYGVGKYNGLSAQSVGRVANNELTWEKQKMFSAALDFALLDSRIRGSIEWYDRKNDAALLNVPYPASTGGLSRMENIGKITNRGIELSLGGDIIKTKDWTVGLTGSYSHNKNKVDGLYGGLTNLPISSTAMTVTKIGLSMDTWYLTQYAGVNPVNGDALYYTENGSVSNNPKAYNPVILEGKSVYPKYFGSFNLNVIYKNFSLSADLYYSGGNYLYNFQRAFLESDGYGVGTQNQSPVLLYNSWKKPGDITDIPRQDAVANRSNSLSTRFLERGDYVRLRNVILSYNFTTEWLKKVSVNNLRVYAQAQNLFTITNFQGTDPEGVGTMYVNYPVARVFTFGVDISF